MERDIDTEFCPSKPLPYACNDSSPMHIDDLFTEIETHTETDQFPASCDILIKKAFDIDSLESPSVIFYDNGKHSFLPICLHDYDRIFLIEEFHSILQEISDDLLELYLIDFHEPHILVDEINEMHLLIHPGIYLILCPEEIRKLDLFPKKSDRSRIEILDGKKLRREFTCFDEFPIEEI